MKFTLTEPRYLRDSILIISELVNEVNLKFTKDKIELIAVDPATVAMVFFRLFSSAFTEYSLEKERTIGISLSQFTQILKRAKPTDILTLELDDIKNRLDVSLKGSTSRHFSLSLLDIDEREQRIPNLTFHSRIETNTLIFNEAIEDMDIIADSLSFSMQGNAFHILSEGSTSTAKVILQSDSDTIIDHPTQEDFKSSYSIEYLKKITKAAKLANTVSLEFGANYPLRAEYKVMDKLSLTFILAPRVPND